jgi:outer membrane protein
MWAACRHLGCLRFRFNNLQQVEIGPRPALRVFTSENMMWSSSKSHPISTKVFGLRIVKSRHLVLVLAFLACIPIRSLAQQAPPDSPAPLLTLDDAVSIALTQNRLVRNSVLEAEKYDFRVSTSRTRRLPQFQFAVLGGSFLQPFDFTFKPGVFGTYPGIGPVPANNSKIRTPAQITTHTTAALDQPLTQQYKIHLGIRLTELGRELAGQEVRVERQKIVNQVRTAYFEILATQAEVDAAGEAVKTLEEAQRVTAEHELQKAVLRADVLEVDTRLLKARYELSTAEDGLATQQEHLNQLLGRDLATKFRVSSMPEDDPADLTLEVARRQAVQNRPEIREAHIKEKQAEYDRRLAKAEYIPDLSLSVRYIGTNNVEVLPKNVAVAGFLLTWEPFDWGRRRNAVAEKSKAIEQARNGMQETESQIAVEVGKNYRKWRETTLLLKALRTGREAAAAQFRVTSNKYKEQAALIKDLLQAQADSAQADYKYQQALSSYWSAFADLRHAIGEE